jgi:endonuclease/exonuclease/phosphatase (EEP) superfamily protein YafD
MKILKIALYSITSILALATIIISSGSAVCKFAEFPVKSLIQACGYIPFLWIVLISAVAIILFLLLRTYRLALSYLSIMLVFTVLLNDFSLKFIFHRIPVNSAAYENLNIGAYNVRYYSFGIDKIARYLSESDFDVILLSESVLTPQKLEYLRSNLSRYSIISDNGHDLSLLTRYPIVNYKIIDLPTNVASLSGGNDIDSINKNGIHRSFIHAVVNVDGTNVNFLSLRLIAGRPKDKSLAESLRWGEYLLNSQNKELAVFLSYVRSLKGPLIFGGDLNVTPNTEIMHKIDQVAEDAYLEEHLYGGLTFNSSFPNERLDYIFHSKDVIVKKSEIVDARLSDHFLVRAQFLIPKHEIQAMRQN